MLADEFRVNHRAASESLMRAVALDADQAEIEYELKQARYFERQAMQHLTSPRQRALGMGLLHACDLIDAVTEAEFHSQ